LIGNLKKYLESISRYAFRRAFVNIAILAGPGFLWVIITPHLYSRVPLSLASCLK